MLPMMLTAFAFPVNLSMNNDFFVYIFLGIFSHLFILFQFIVLTPYPGWAKLFCALLTIVCTVYIPVFIVYIFATKKSMFEKEEAEEFPQQDLFNHYDLGAKDPYYPPVLDVLNQQMR